MARSCKKSPAGGNTTASDRPGKTRAHRRTRRATVLAWPAATRRCPITGPPRTRGHIPRTACLVPLVPAGVVAEVSRWTIPNSPSGWSSGPASINGAARMSAPASSSRSGSIRSRSRGSTTRADHKAALDAGRGRTRPMVRGASVRRPGMRLRRRRPGGVLPHPGGRGLMNEPWLVTFVITPLTVVAFAWVAVWLHERSLARSIQDEERRAHGSSDPSRAQRDRRACIAPASTAPSRPGASPPRAQRGRLRDRPGRAVPRLPAMVGARATGRDSARGTTTRQGPRQPRRTRQRSGCGLRPLRPSSGRAGRGGGVRDLADSLKRSATARRVMRPLGGAGRAAGARAPPHTTGGRGGGAA